MPPHQVRFAATLELVLLLGVSLSFGQHAYGARNIRKAEIASEANQILFDKLIVFKDVDVVRGFNNLDDSLVDDEYIRDRISGILELAESISSSSIFRKLQRKAESTPESFEQKNTYLV